MKNTNDTGQHDEFSRLEHNILNKIIELLEKYPNDQELGKNLRSLLTRAPITKHTSNYLLYLDNSHEKGY